MNSADDIGNPGPDYKHGWGQVNSYRAVKMLENNNYFSSSVSQGNTNPYTINVPSGVSKVKVMVYWHDKEASTSASIALVNDINIQICGNSLCGIIGTNIDWNINNISSKFIFNNPNKLNKV